MAPGNWIRFLVLLESLVVRYQPGSGRRAIKSQNRGQDIGDD